MIRTKRRKEADSAMTTRHSKEIFRVSLSLRIGQTLSSFHRHGHLEEAMFQTGTSSMQQ